MTHKIFDTTQSYESAEDMVWKSVCDTAVATVEAEPEISELFDDVILSRDNLFEAIMARLARKLGRFAMPEEKIFKIFMHACTADIDMRSKILADLIAIKERDPACETYLQPILYYKGFHAITTHRVAHRLWHEGRKQLAYYLQSLSSEIFAVDIHPAAPFGGGILLDHATSFVAGETSVVDDNVSILHEVTLGGTGNAGGDRHPKIKSGVLIGAGAKLLGNITVGECAKIGAGSVVITDVPAHTTVAGVPARPVGKTSEALPAMEMNQMMVEITRHCGNPPSSKGSK